MNDTARDLIKRATERLTPDYDDPTPATTEFKRYLREMDAVSPYDRFDGENIYERLYRELGYGNLREETEDVGVSPYTQADSDRMIDEYFATITRKKEIGKEEDECFQRLAQTFNDFNEELL